MLTQDPAIHVQKGYYPYDSGLDYDVFIKYADSNEPLQGLVWPGATVFPDFTNPETVKWWIAMATMFHATVPFDGIWIVSKLIKEKNMYQILLNFD